MTHALQLIEVVLGSGCNTFVGGPHGTRDLHPLTPVYVQMSKIMKEAKHSKDEDRRRTAFLALRLFTSDGLYLHQNMEKYLHFHSKNAHMHPMDSIVLELNGVFPFLPENEQAAFSFQASQNRHKWWNSVFLALDTGGPFPDMYHTPVEHESKELRAITRAVRSAKTTEDCDVCLQKVDARMAALHARLQDLGIEEKRDALLFKIQELKKLEEALL